MDSFKGITLFHGVSDYRNYINDRYFSTLDFIFAKKDFTTAFIFFDVCMRSFLFRTTFILDILFMHSLENEILKRQQILTDLVVLYTEKLLYNKISLSKVLINKFRETHLRLRDVIISYDDISGLSIICIVLFFIMYLLTDINGFVSNVNKGKLN